jgi:hypothetical protein
VDGFGNEVVGTAAVGALDRIGIVQAGEHHDRQIGASWEAAQAAAGFEAVYAGHDDIQQHQVRL